MSPGRRDHLLVMLYSQGFSCVAEMEGDAKGKSVCTFQTRRFMSSLPENT